MENKKDYSKCSWKDCEKCNEIFCRKTILKMLSKKGKTMETKEQKIERIEEEIRELKYLKMDYERNIKDCEELIKKAEQQLKDLEGK